MTPPLGTKLDTAKPRCDLLPPLALLGAADVLGYGARKYAPGNWRLVPDARERYLAAALRHVLAAMAGEERDPESGFSHLDHAVCSLLFVSELEKRSEGAAGAQASRCAAQVEDATPRRNGLGPTPSVYDVTWPRAGSSPLVRVVAVVSDDDYVDIRKVCVGHTNEGPNVDLSNYGTRDLLPLYEAVRQAERARRAIAGGDA